MNTGIYVLALYIALALPMIFLIRSFSLTAKQIPLSYLLLMPLPLSAAIAYPLAIALWPKDADGGLFSALIFAFLVFVVAVVLAVVVAIILFRAFAKLRHSS